jgi:DNA-binding GntR family transcriptional regulator
MGNKQYEDIVCARELARRAASAGRPMALYQAVSEDIAGRIERGMWRAGDQLPSTTDLCQRYEVSTVVIRNAMLQLKERRLIQGMPGIGVFVAAAGEPR